jgi:hypothetical protein
VLRDHRQRLDETLEPVRVVVLGELQRRLLETRPSLLGREARQELGEQLAPLRRLAGLAEPHREQQAELEIVRHERPGSAERFNARRLFAHPFVRLHEEPRRRMRLRESQRRFGDRRERFPCFLRDELLAEREQRLMCALELAIQRARGGEQVLHRPARVRLAHAPRALVAEPLTKPSS